MAVLKKSGKSPEAAAGLHPASFTPGTAPFAKPPGGKTASGGKAGESPSGAREKPACRAGADGGRGTARIPRRFADPLRLHCRYSASGRRPLSAPRTNAAPACAAAAGLAAAVLEFVLEPDVSGAPPDPFALPHGEACMEGMGIVPLTGKAGTRVRGGFNAPGGDRRAHDIGDGFPVQWHEDVPVPLQTGVGSRETLMEEVNALPLALPLAPCERADAPEGRVAVIPSGINPRCDEYGGSYGQFRSEGAMNYRVYPARGKTTAKTVSRLRSLQ